MTPNPSTSAQQAERLTRLEQFLQGDPDNPSLVSEAAQLAMQAGWTDRAQGIVNAARNANPGEPSYWHLQASLHLAAHQFEQAAVLLQQLYADNPAPGIRFNLAYAQFCLGDYETALAHFAALLGQADAPQKTLAYALRSLHRLGRFAPALELLDRAPPGQVDAEALGVASAVAMDIDDADLSNALATRALKLDSDQVEALATRGGLLTVAGDTSTALAMLGRATQIRPHDGRIWTTLALAQMRTQDLAKAEASFRQALRFMPKHLGTWHGLAWSQIARGDLTAAQHSLQTALELDRNFGETHGGLAVVAALQGQREQALAHAERARRLDPKGMSVHYAQAVLSGQARDAQAIQRLAERLLRSRIGGAPDQANPSDPPTEH